MRSRRRGANAIEFALILPVLVALMSGVVDYGYMFAVRYVAGAAVEEAARVGSQIVHPEDPTPFALTAAQRSWDKFGLHGRPTFSVTYEGSPELVIVRADVAPISLVGLVPIGAFHVSAVRRREQP